MSDFGKCLVRVYYFLFESCGPLCLSGWRDAAYEMDELQTVTPDVRLDYRADEGVLQGDVVVFFPPSLLWGLWGAAYNVKGMEGRKEGDRKGKESCGFNGWKLY